MTIAQATRIVNNMRTNLINQGNTMGAQALGYLVEALKLSTEQIELLKSINKALVEKSKREGKETT